jgi:hypothetical protein
MKPPPATVALRLVGAVAAGAYAWWAVSRPAFSASATGAVLVAGVAAVAAGARTRRPRRPVAAVRGWGAWAAVAAGTALWQLGAYLQHPREDHPTLSSLANGLLDSHPARAAAFVLWLAGAVHLARR